MPKKEYGNKEKSIPLAVGMGAGISMAAMLIGTLVVALMVTNQTIGEDATGYGVIIVTVLSAIIGSTVSILIARSRVLILSLLTSISFAMILLAMTALFFGGQYSGVPVTILVIIGSGVSVALIAGKYLNQPKSYRRKR